MPFDSLPQETKTDPLSLEALVAWLERQPAHRTYKFFCSFGGCLIDLYLLDHGMGIESYGDVDGIYIGPGQRVGLSIACPEPHTFGAALSRARALLPSQ